MRHPYPGLQVAAPKGHDSMADRASQVPQKIDGQ